MYKQKNWLIWKTYLCICAGHRRTAEKLRRVSRYRHRRRRRLWRTGSGRTCPVPGSTAGRGVSRRLVSKRPCPRPGPSLCREPWTVWCTPWPRPVPVDISSSFLQWVVGYSGRMSCNVEGVGKWVWARHYRYDVCAGATEKSTKTLEKLHKHRRFILCLQCNYYCCRFTYRYCAQ